MKLSEKHLKILFVILVTGITLYFQVMRLINIPITWDEGLTYAIHCRNIFRENDFVTGITKYLTEFSEDAANNHLLNTLMIGAADKIFGTEYDQTVIRFPICLFFVLYLYLCIKEFLQGKISWIGFVFLLGCSYVNEFFALARGYAMAATLVFFSTVMYKRWVDSGKDRYIVFAFYLLLLAETANTATILLTASVAVAFFIKMIFEKRLLSILKKLWLPMVIYAGLQILVVIHHMHISEWDESLYADNEGTVADMLINMLNLHAETAVFSVISISIFAILVALNIYFLVKKKTKISDYDIAILIPIYALICFAAVTVTTEGGYPLGRVLIITHPVVALTLDQLCTGLRKGFDGEKAGRILRPLTVLGVAFILTMLIVNTDPTKSTDWPEAQLYKDTVYEVYNNKMKVDRDYFKKVEQNTDAFRYWRWKIIDEDGVDVYSEMVFD
ncbi:MAG: hypothetical protein K5888_07465 [Lachnospiraceae bacterium]|nr:hypothetical protein [Lachnospiraceae bacterium]